MNHSASLFVSNQLSANSSSCFDDMKKIADVLDLLTDKFSRCGKKLD